MNIELMTLTDVEQIEGSHGHFTVTLLRHPRYVDMNKCISCGECARKCPVKVKDEYNQGINFRKAVYIKYPQAVPLKYQIDAKHCLRLTKGECGICEAVCPPGAIRFDDRERELTIHVGSIILAPGYKNFDPSGIRTWGYGIFPNVITSMEFERYLSVAGPTEGRIMRPSDGGAVKKVAFLQCVGSRDYNKASHGYCSSVCCMYAIKEALLAMDHVEDLEVSIFFIDMRTPGKGFERYYELARERGMKFHRCRVHSLEPTGNEGRLFLRYITDEGKQVKDEFDLVVLSVGMETSDGVADLAKRAGVDLNKNGFAVTSSFNPVATTKPGIFACGTFTGPKDIPRSVTEASAAATAAAIHLIDVRYSLFRQKKFPVERDVWNEEPRVGVFVCHCGTNIARTVDVEAVAKYAATLPYVSYVEKTLFACSQDSQDVLRQRIEEKGLNRIVVASCTPRTHEALFKETLKASGLNEYLFEMANIRNQVSWVHAGEPETATQKAKDMVRMAVAKATLLAPLPPVTVNVNPQALVIGGGVAGMVATLGLADQGFPVHLVEKGSQLGGNARHLYKTWKNESIPAFVERLVSRIRGHELISVHLKSTVVRAEGFVGNFRSTIRNSTVNTTVEHGVTILATGGQAYKPDGYGYSLSQKVLTALEFDKLHLVGDERVKYGQNYVFIQCVGSREPDRPFCSRVCCTHAIQSAISLKEEDPERNVFVLYQDIRSYGQREELYTKARELGVIFINYSVHQKPNIMINEEDVSVVVWDHVLHEPFSIDADVVILSTAIVPNPDTKDLAKLYRLQVGSDGFLQEAHVKLRPVDFATDGIFLAGLAHFPKPIEEAITEAQAAVARAVTVLSDRRIELDSNKARLDLEKCDHCALCVDVCPYQAIQLEAPQDEEDKQRVVVNVAKCKGCGVCQATCPKDGINVGGFTYRQLSAQVEAAMK